MDSDRLTNPEATGHAEIIRAALDDYVPSPLLDHSGAMVALDALLAERDAAVKERDEWFAQHQALAADHYFARAEAAEASLTRYRNEAGEVIDRLITEAVEKWHTVTNDDLVLHSWLGLTWEEYKAWVEGGATALIARAALDGPKEEQEET